MYKLVDSNSLFSIIDADIEEDILKDVGKSKVEFKDQHSIILYTALCSKNFELLKKTQYKKIIRAYEYPEYAMGVDQADVLVKISYNTQGLYDTLNHKAYNEIQSCIKKINKKKSEITDIDIQNYLLTIKKFTGIRVHAIDTTKKAYTQTKMFYGHSTLTYLLNPNNIEIIDTKNLIY